MPSSKPTEAHPALGHIMLVGTLLARVKPPYSVKVRREARAELDRYYDQGLIHQRYREEPSVAKPRNQRQPRTYAGQGIIYAVIDDREAMRDGRVTTIDVIAEAIEAALDAGHEDSESIARYLTTSAFQHVTDKRVRFNSVLKAGDVVGAQMVRKLHNSYNDLVKLATDEPDPVQKKLILAEATGFAEALNVVLSPFSVEDSADPRLVDWEELDRITAAFEKEQRLVIKERKGNPQ